MTACPPKELTERCKALRIEPPRSDWVRFCECMGWTDLIPKARR